MWMSVDHMLRVWVQGGHVWSWISYLGYVGREVGSKLLTDAASWMEQPPQKDVADEKSVICRIICICLLERTLALIEDCENDSSNLYLDAA